MAPVAPSISGVRGNRRVDSESSRTHVINNGAFVQIVGHKQEQASVLAQPCYHGGTMTMKFKAAILWLATAASAVAQTPTPQLATFTLWPLEIVSSQNITSLTMTPIGSGVTINTPAGYMGGLVANSPLKLQYVLTPNQWRVR